MTLCQIPVPIAENQRDKAPVLRPRTRPSPSKPSPTLPGGGGGVQGQGRGESEVRHSSFVYVVQLRQEPHVSFK